MWWILCDNLEFLFCFDEINTSVGELWVSILSCIIWVGLNQPNEGLNKTNPKKTSFPRKTEFSSRLPSDFICTIRSPGCLLILDHNCTISSAGSLSVSPHIATAPMVFLSRRSEGLHYRFGFATLCNHLRQYFTINLFIHTYIYTHTYMYTCVCICIYLIGSVSLIILYKIQENKNRKVGKKEGTCIQVRNDTEWNSMRQDIQVTQLEVLNLLEDLVWQKDKINIITNATNMRIHGCI